MNLSHSLRLLVSAAFIAAAFGLAAGRAVAAEPVRLIFDTDMGNDVDDALALGMIHSLESRGECELLAVTVTKDHQHSAPFIDAVNTWYGRPDIPIGVVKDGPTQHESRFTGLATQRDDGRLRYPHDLRDGREAPGATGLLRKVLAAQPDGSVVVVQVGFSTNLARLLESKADEHSPLSGRELVERKVKHLSIMAGSFDGIPGHDRYREYNVIKDIPAAKALAEHWPTPIIYSGYEIGLSIPYPSESIEQDYDYTDHHPLAEAYRLYMPPPHDRPTWDLTSVLWAVYPERGYFELSPPGRVTVHDDGFTSFEKRDGGPHRYLIADEIQRARVREALVQLSSQPPQRGDSEQHGRPAGRDR